MAINNRRANVFLVESFSGRIQGKYTLPINEGAEKKIKASHAFVELIRKLRPCLTKNLPESSLCSTNFSSFDYTKAVSGVPLNMDDYEDLNLFFNFLTELNQFSLSEHDIQGIAREFDIRDALSLSAKKLGINGEIEDVVQKAQIIHGDLTKENMLLSKKKPRRLTVIDFEHAKVGPAVFNWYDFLLRNIVIDGGGYPIKKDIVLQRCRKLPGNKNAKPLFNEFTAKFLSACQIPFSLHGKLMLVYMIYLLRDPVVSRPEVVIQALTSMDFRI